MPVNTTVTLKQIAGQASCSIGAVSAVLNDAKGNIGVSDDLRVRIERVAVQLGYEANYFAQALRSGRSFTVGLLVGSDAREPVHSGLWGQLVEGVDLTVRAGGSDLLIIGPASAETEIDRSIRYLKQGRIDALIVPGLLYRTQLEQLRGLAQPVVVALPAGPGALPSVRTDTRTGLREAVRHLAALGHRRIVWIDYHEDGASAVPHRKTTVVATAAQCGITVTAWHVDAGKIADPHSHAQFIDGCARQIMRYLSRRRRTPTAIICYNERIALGAYVALADKGLRVPRDVSVIGIDNIYADMAVPAMTVVSMRIKAVGEAVARLAIEMAGERWLVSEMQGHAETIATDLVIRASTGPARRDAKSSRTRAEPVC